MYITPLKVYHYDILLIHKPYDMSLLLFHQGNVPIIEDDMKFAEIKLENSKTTGKNWLYIGFVTPEDVLSQIVMDLIEGRIDGIKLVMDLTAFKGPHNPEGAITTGFPYFTVNYDNQRLNIQVAGSGIIMPTDDQASKINYINIYADGDLEISLIDNM